MNDDRTNDRMSFIARRMLDLPEAFAPKTPAAGRTPMGRPPSRQGIRRTTALSERLVESSDISNGSRNDRMLEPRNARSIDASVTAFSSLTDGFSQEMRANATISGLRFARSIRERASRRSNCRAERLAAWTTRPSPLSHIARQVQVQLESS